MLSFRPSAVNDLSDFKGGLNFVRSIRRYERRAVVWCRCNITELLKESGRSRLVAQLQKLINKKNPNALPWEGAKSSEVTTPTLYVRMRLSKNCWGPEYCEPN